MKEDPFKKYADKFSETNLWKKINTYAKESGQGTIYSALLMFYAWKRKETPTWAKNIVLGALGYFLMPIDGIPDLTPFLGFTDDLGVLSFGLVAISCYINNEVRNNARTKMTTWFGELDEEELDRVDKDL